MGDLQKKFTSDIAPKLQKELGLQNLMAVPRIEKIVLNTGLKEGLKEAKVIEEAVLQLSVITGQKPVVTRAKMAIAGFKLRKGDAIGAMVTLRGNRMYDFFERLVNVVLPRVRDFHGVSTTSFDGHGSYSIGFRESSVFPEIDSAASKSLGLQVTIKTNTHKDQEAKKLLEDLGMPFKKVPTRGGSASGGKS